MTNPQDPLKPGNNLVRPSNTSGVPFVSPILDGWEIAKTESDREIDSRYCANMVYGKCNSAEAPRAKLKRPTLRRRVVRPSGFLGLRERRRANMQSAALGFGLLRVVVCLSRVFWSIAARKAGAEERLSFMAGRTSDMSALDEWAAATLFSPARSMEIWGSWRKADAARPRSRPRLPSESFRWSFDHAWLLQAAVLEDV